MSTSPATGSFRSWIRRILYGSAFMIVTLTIFLACAVILMNWQMRAQIHERSQLAASNPPGSPSTVVLGMSRPEVSLNEQLMLGGLVCLGLALSASLAWRLATGRGLLPQNLVSSAGLPYRLGMSFAVLGHLLAGVTLLAVVFLLPDVQDNPNADPDVLAIPIALALMAYAISVAVIELSIGVRAVRGGRT